MAKSLHFMNVIPRSDIIPATKIPVAKIPSVIIPVAKVFAAKLPVKIRYLPLLSS